MCGRFALYATLEELTAHFQLKIGFKMSARYNVAPTQTIPIVTKYRAGIEFAKWSFLPSWHKADDNVEKAGYINARSETLCDKPTFRKAFLKSRCIIPASGYYEWKVIKGKKQPFYITIKEAPIMGLAGIWSLTPCPMMGMRASCAILTKPSEAPLDRVHERMPVILTPDTYAHWLDVTKSQTDLQGYCAKDNQFQWQLYPVSTQVNSPKVDTPFCIAAL